MSPAKGTQPAEGAQPRKATHPFTTQTIAEHDMAELKIFYRDADKQDKIKVGRSVNILSSLDKKDIIWIDLLDVSDKTEGDLEEFLKIDIQDDEETIPS